MFEKNWREYVFFCPFQSWFEWTRFLSDEIYQNCKNFTVLEAGDVKSLLEQFEATEASVKLPTSSGSRAKKESPAAAGELPSKKADRFNQSLLKKSVEKKDSKSYKNICDTLPKEVIDRIKVITARKSHFFPYFFFQLYFYFNLKKKKTVNSWVYNVLNYPEIIKSEFRTLRDIYHWPDELFCELGFGFGFGTQKRYPCDINAPEFEANAQEGWNQGAGFSRGSRDVKSKTRQRGKFFTFFSKIFKEFAFFMWKDL